MTKITKIRFVDVEFRGKNIGEVEFTGQKAYRFYKLVAENNYNKIKEELDKEIVNFMV